MCIIWRNSYVVMIWHPRLHHDSKSNKDSSPKQQSQDELSRTTGNRERNVHGYVFVFQYTRSLALACIVSLEGVIWPAFFAKLAIFALRGTTKDEGYLFKMHQVTSNSFIFTTNTCSASRGENIVSCHRLLYFQNPQRLEIRHFHKIHIDKSRSNGVARSPYQVEKRVPPLTRAPPTPVRL